MCMSTSWLIASAKYPAYVSRTDSLSWFTTVSSPIDATTLSERYSTSLFRVAREPHVTENQVPR